MKKTILIILTSLLLVSQVSAEQAEKRNKHPMAKVLMQLDLSDQQKQDIKQQLKSNRADRAVYREDGKQMKSALREIITADNWDQAAATETLLASADLKQNQLNSRAITHHNIWLLLTDDQQQALSQITDERGMGDAADKESRKQKKWQKVAKRLDLSDEQIAAIDSIHNDFEQQKIAFKELKMAHKATEREIIRNDTFDQAAWENLYAEHEQAMLEHGVAKAYMRHQVLAELTEAQQAKLQKFQSKMKKKRNRSKQV